jgi:hypothetical protein
VYSTPGEDLLFIYPPVVEFLSPIINSVQFFLYHLPSPVSLHVLNITKSGEEVKAGRQHERNANYAKLE